MTRNVRSRRASPFSMMNTGGKTMKTRIIGLAVIGVVGLGLVACSGERQTVRGEDGERVEIAHGSAATRMTAVDLPSFLPVYPGGRIESTVGGVSSGSTGSQKGGMMVFVTGDAPDRVAAFYRSRLDGSGLTERTDANLNGVLMMTASSADDVDRGVQVSIAPEEHGSRVTLIYSNGGA